MDEYLSTHLVPDDPVLDAVLSASAAAGLPSHHVTPIQGRFLQLLALAQGARAVLEVGTLGGYSAIWLARALPRDGRVITLEVDTRHAEVARENIDRAGLGGVVEVRVGAALDLLPALLAEGAGPFDLVFIDADKASTAAYLTLALELCRVGSLILVDNVVRGGALVDPARTDADVEGVRRGVELLGEERRVKATAVQTVGSKGYDGFVLALVVHGS